MPDGFTLYESRAICRFLSALFSLPYVPPPSDLKARALFDQAEGAEAGHFSPAADAVSYERFTKGIMGLEADEKKVAEARGRMGAHVYVLEGLLGAQEYMAGMGISLVDICYIVLLDRLRNCGERELVSGRKNMNAWWERCLGRPAVREFLDGLLSLEDIKKRVAAVKS
jgi:glutathione S-transferase